MKCPDCGLETKPLPCSSCVTEAARRESEMEEVVREFSLVRGVPRSPELRRSLESAVTCVRKVGQGRWTVSFRKEDVLMSDRWWYIPHTWIGCMGFIVDRGSGYVNWLGSASLRTLGDCFWGHDHGLVCDLVDFTFGQETDRALAARLLTRFHHMHPNAQGKLPRWAIPYRDSEIPAALAKQFPIFRRHHVWLAIPEIREAYEKGELRFTCSLSADR